MKDSEIRGLILRYYYDRRREGWTLPKASDLGMGLSLNDNDVLYVADQLAQHGLLEWRKLGSHGEVRTGMGKINAFGIDVVEGGAQSELKVEFVQNKTINITGSQNVVVGDNNHASQSIRDLVHLIEHSDGSPEQKQEAKSLLRKFLEHPLVSAAAGGAIGLLG
jgi:hypothetical protein